MKLMAVAEDRTSRVVLGEILNKLGHDVVLLEDGRRAWDAWQQDEYSLLICDVAIPEQDGVTLCRKIRAEERAIYPYIILLASRGGMGYVEAVRAGADDLITKPFDDDLLAARLHVAQRILSLQEQLRMQAVHDPLTGLLNRGAILDGLKREVQRAAREGGCIGVIMADLDHFKQINDFHGHLIGDAVLKEAARRMQAVLRSCGQVGRYGGEEFLIVAPSRDENLARTVAERLRAAIGTTPMSTSVGDLAVTASLGAVTARGQDLRSADQLIAAADAALYGAKHEGRNRVEVFDRDAGFGSSASPSTPCHGSDFARVE